MRREVRKVSQVVNLVKSLLESQLNDILVEGEVSNMTASSSGHYYFGLSDKESFLSCALFRLDSIKNPILNEIKDGDKIICHGYIGVYSKRGTFQLIVKKIYKAGKGLLALQFEQLKKELAAAGLFDLEKKQKISPYARKVALITSANGAALHDFIKVYERRSLWMDIKIFPSLVQGEQASLSIREALYRALNYDDFDVIVITRGGGSVEDLWAFNDKQLAYAIYEAERPIISAIGHQVDYTICDYVADLRAETPTAAAELLTEYQLQLKEKFVNIKKHLKLWWPLFYKKYQMRIEKGNPRVLIDELWPKLHQYQKRLTDCYLADKDHRILRIHERQFELDDLFQRLQFGIDKKLSDYKTRLDHLNDLQKSVNPQGILKKGYVYLKQDDSIIGNKKDFDKLLDGSFLDIQFSDGTRKLKKEQENSI